MQYMKTGHSGTAGQGTTLSPCALRSSATALQGAPGIAARQRHAGADPGGPAGTPGPGPPRLRSTASDPTAERDSTRSEVTRSRGPARFPPAPGVLCPPGAAPGAPHAATHLHPEAVTWPADVTARQPGLAAPRAARCPSPKAQWGRGAFLPHRRRRGLQSVGAGGRRRAAGRCLRMRREGRGLGSRESGCVGLTAHSTVAPSPEPCRCSPTFSPVPSAWAPGWPSTGCGLSCRCW